MCFQTQQQINQILRPWDNLNCEAMHLVLQLWFVGSFAIEFENNQHFICILRLFDILFIKISPMGFFHNIHHLDLEKKSFFKSNMWCYTEFWIPFLVFSVFKKNVNFFNISELKKSFFHERIRLWYLSIPNYRWRLVFQIFDIVLWEWKPVS